MTYVESGNDVLREWQHPRGHVVRERVAQVRTLRAAVADSTVTVTLHRPDLGTDEWDGRQENESVDVVASDGDGGREVVSLVDGSWEGRLSLSGQVTLKADGVDPTSVVLPQASFDGWMLAAREQVGHATARKVMRDYPDLRLAVDKHNGAVLRSVIDDAHSDGVLTDDERQAVIDLADQHHLPGGGSGS